MTVDRRKTLASIAGSIIVPALGSRERPCQRAQRVVVGQSPPRAGEVDATPALPMGWQEIAYSVLLDGTPAIVGADVDLRQEWRRDADGRVLGRLVDVAVQASARIWTYDGRELRAVHHSRWKRHFQSSTGSPMRTDRVRRKGLQ